MKMKTSYPGFSAAILAGGANSRFNGQIKSLIPFCHKPILEHQLEVLLPLFEEILLITNQPEHFSKYHRVKMYRDLIPGKGPLSGIHTALQKIKNNKVLIVAGDMPFIHAQIIIRLVEEAEKHECDAVIPVDQHNIEPLHGIYNKTGIRKLEDLLQMDQTVAVREFLGLIHTRYLEITNEKPFININTPEELKNYEKNKGYKD